MHALEEEMATHSSILAWRIPGMEEPGGLPSMGSHRVGHDWSDLAAVAAAACVSPCFCLPPAPWQPPFLRSLFLWSWFWLFVCFASTCKWHHTVFVFLYLAYFTCCNGLQVYSCCCKRRDSCFFFFKWLSNVLLCVYVCIPTQLLSCVLLFVTPWSIAGQSSSVHGISQARILEWVAISSPKDLQDPGIEPTSPESPLVGGFFTTEPPGKLLCMYIYILYRHIYRQTHMPTFIIFFIHLDI